MKNTKKILAVVLAAAMILVCFAGCTKKADEAKTLVMATNAEFPPYEFKEGDKVVGIDAEVMQAICDKIGYTLKIEDMAFDSIIPAVQSGKADVGAAGMTITDERKQEVDFTDTYATAKQVVIVREDAKITSIDDLAGKKVGVQQGTTGDIYASDSVENGGFGEENVDKYSKGAEAVTALTQNKVSAVIIDNQPAQVFVKNANEGGNVKLVILDEAFADEEYAICVKKGNTELLDKINKALGELKADGTFDKIVGKYISAK